jgi:hypothetical protein
MYRQVAKDRGVDALKGNLFILPPAYIHVLTHRYLYFAAALLIIIILKDVISCPLTEMEFIHGKFLGIFWRLRSNSSLCLILGLVFSFYKMLFMNRLEFSCLMFFVWIFRTKVEPDFL